MIEIIYRRICLSIIIFLVGVSPSLATHPDSKSDIENLKQRIQKLETGMAQKATEDPSFTLLAARKHLVFSGLLELEGSYNDTEGENANSDLNLTTFEFSTEVAINDSIGGHVILLYEEDPEDESLKVDEVVISLRCPKPFMGQSLAFYGGKMYLPFGKFNSTMVSDPITLELGETSDTAGVFAFEGELWNFSLGIFNGGTDASNDKDHLDSLVFALELTPVENLSFGISWISDLAESDIELVADPAVYEASVAGASAFVSASLGAFGFEGGILAALDHFDAALVGLDTNGDGTPDTDLTGERPLVWNVEVSWMPTNTLQLAIRYEKASDFQDDVTRYGVAGSYGIFTNTVIALEYLHRDSKNDPNSDTATVQLAFEF